MNFDQFLFYQFFYLFFFIIFIKSNIFVISDILILITIKKKLKATRSSTTTSIGIEDP